MGPYYSSQNPIRTRPGNKHLNNEYAGFLGRASVARAECYSAPPVNSLGESNSIPKTARIRVFQSKSAGFPRNGRNLHRAICEPLGLFQNHEEPILVVPILFASSCSARAVMRKNYSCSKTAARSTMLPGVSCSSGACRLYLGWIAQYLLDGLPRETQVLQKSPGQELRRFVVLDKHRGERIVV